MGLIKGSTPQLKHTIEMWSEVRWSWCWMSRIQRSLRFGDVVNRFACWWGWQQTTAAILFQTDENAFVVDLNTKECIVPPLRLSDNHWPTLPPIAETPVYFHITIKISCEWSRENYACVRGIAVRVRASRWVHTRPSYVECSFIRYTGYPSFEPSVSFR